MEKSSIDLFVVSNADKFAPEAVPVLRQTLEKMDDNKFVMLQSVEFKNPTMILLIAILLGWERFFLDDIGMGVLKILTCGGFGIWYIIDMFTAIDRTKKYNYNRFVQMTAMM